MNILSEKVVAFGEHDENTRQQILTAAQDKRVVRAALMPDGHYGYNVPIGGVLAYKDAISPSGVGFDIACGNKAVRLDVHGFETRPHIAAIMDEVFKVISFGVGRKNNEKVDAAVLDKSGLGWYLESTKPLYDKAAAQLGTVGSGNHYVDIFTDEADRVWIGVHFGSRGFGHGIATWFLKAAGASQDMAAAPCVLDINSDLGQQYIHAMSLAGQYAYAGRDWVCERVAKIIGGKVLESIHNHHNYAWLEEHNGEDLWVVRKGATPAYPGQKCFVGGSLGEQSVILAGIESTESSLTLSSTVHGAGRAMGRKEATGTFDRKTGECKRPGKVTQEMLQGWVDRSGIELRGAGLDESTDCYKRLDSVLGYVSNQVRILHRLTPIGVAMAGKDTFDPYKD